ncbi:MAG: tetratricopeptide repeat protein [Endomicrobium sp.]|jgi:tetratricopeptide (TPR) repeat protein|nr:tetratricopeptide repeat protein [Endomicrobium sp.]
MRGISHSVKESKAEKVGNFIVKQIKENKTRVLTTAAFTVGVLLFAIFVFMRWQALDYSASDKLSAAYMLISSGDRTQAVQYLNDTISRFPNTPAAYQARLTLGDILTETAQYDEALPLFQITYKKGKPAALKPLGLFRMIYLYASKKDYDNAILYSNEFVKNFSGNFLIKNVYMNLAQFYTIKNLPEDAKRVYTEILTNFPATNEAAKADEILKGL